MPEGRTLEVPLRRNDHSRAISASQRRAHETGYHCQGNTEPAAIERVSYASNSRCQIRRYLDKAEVCVSETYPLTKAEILSCRGFELVEYDVRVSAMFVEFPAEDVSIIAHRPDGF